MSNAGREDIAARVPRGTMELLDGYVALLREEADRQNLIAPSTIATLWQRHILDSLQLVALAEAGGAWVDVGSGAGLPGMVVAIATERTVTLVEPRRLRAAFLARVTTALGLNGRVTVAVSRAEGMAAPSAPAGIISARAVAPLPKLFAMAAHLADARTQWLLPKGRGAEAEVAAARRSWHGVFRLVPSLTESPAMIVDARQVRPKRQQ